MIRHVPARALPLAVLLAAACATKSGGGGGESDTSIQASIAATEDVEFIDIKVTRLDNGAVVYYSGQQPAENHFAGRRDLMRDVILEADTDFLFDATAYDSAHGSAIHALTVQKRTQPAGIHTEVVIVIDLNEGAQSDGGPTSETDITAITDNIPVMYPPVLSDIPVAGTPVTISYHGTDADWPVDPYETMTFFTTVLNGSMTGDADTTTNTGTTFNLGQTFSFTPIGSDPIDLVCGVIDHWGRIAYVILHIDPSSGAFGMVAQGEGYGVMPDTGTLPPQQPKRAEAPSESAPPAAGPMGVAILKRNDTSPHAILAITNTADNARVAPDDLAWWIDGTVKSFNIYQNNGVLNPVVNKLRVEITPPSRGSALIDTLKFIPGANFAYGPQVQETPLQLLPPSITNTLTGSAGGIVHIEGANLDGLSMAYLADGNGDFAGVLTAVSGGDDHGSGVLPAKLPNGEYALHIFTYGRLTNSAPITITAPAKAPVWVAHRLLENNGSIVALNDANVAVGSYNDGESDHAAIWIGDVRTLLATPPGAAGRPRGINGANTVVGGMTDSEHDLPVAWNGPDELIYLALPDGFRDGDAVSINATGAIAGTLRDTRFFTPETQSIAVVWTAPNVHAAVKSLPDYAGASFGSEAVAINDAGQIAGTALFGGEPTVFRALRWEDSGAPTLLNTPAGLNSTALGMNRHGDVAGFVVHVGDGDGRAAIWNGTQLVMLPDPLRNTWASAAEAINDDGIVVGFAQDDEHNYVVVWVPNGGGYVSYVIAIGGGNAINSSGVIGGANFGAPTRWLPTPADPFYAATSTYTQTALYSAPDWQKNYVNAINPSGVIAGRYVDDSGHHAYRLVNGAVKRLNSADDDNSDPGDINAAGDIAGTFNDAEGANHAVVWLMNGTTRILEHKNAGAAGLNDAGQAVGNFNDDNNVTHAAFWDGVTLTALQEPAGTFQTSASGINNSGAIVGIDFSAGALHAVLWTDSAASPTFLEGQGIAVKINDAGVVVGGALPEGAFDVHAAAWVNGSLNLLPDPFPYLASSFANDIDESGRITGEARTFDGRVYAVLWIPEATGWRAELLTPASGDPSATGNAISNGRVVGFVDVGAVIWAP